jgi:hypothetical protein
VTVQPGVALSLTLVHHGAMPPPTGWHRHSVVLRNVTREALESDRAKPQMR